MKKLIILLIAALCISCQVQKQKPAYSIALYNLTPLDTRHELFEMEYEGHKYIILSVSNGVDITHSASCNCREESPVEYVHTYKYIYSWKDSVLQRDTIVHVEKLTHK